MAEYLWTRIKSWHLTDEVVDPAYVRTLCGLRWDETLARDPEPPADQKTCERCFQIREGRR